LKVLKPSKNKQTQGYSDKHKGYDHSGRGDLNYYSSFFGKVVQAKNSETKNWTNTGKLTTKDYGNYIKIKGEVDGKTFYQLGAHFQPGSVLPKGTEVKRGQVVARIGNTGNSTARHSHTEYRDADDKNFPVVFVDDIKENKNMQSKEQIIIDAYKAITGEYPSDDEKKARLQKNENTMELIYDLLNGDAKSKPRWLEIWGVKENQESQSIIESYKDQLHLLNETLRSVGIRQGDDFASAVAKVQSLVTSYLEQEKAVKEALVKSKSKPKEDYIWEFNLLGLIIRFLLKRGDKDE